MNIDELLIDFDEMGFAPTTLCKNSNEYACKWKKQLLAEIEKLKAENNKLDKESTSYGSIIQKQDKEIEDLRLQNIELQKRNEKWFSDYFKEQKRFEKQCVRTVKQAVKEFAEKLKKYSYTDNCFTDGKWHRYVLVSDIDELLKEYEK